MNKELLKKYLTQYREGQIDTEKMIDILKELPFKNIDYAKIDHHRTLRKGLPEVIYGENKSAKQIIGIIDELKNYKTNILVTRLNTKKASKILLKFPEGKYNKIGRVFRYDNSIIENYKNGKILLITAGTSDLYVAAECAETLKSFGFKSKKIFDVGVAGLHRLLNYTGMIQKADIIIVFAGMEGALPSVVGGLSDSPVIAVPTSVGYGSSLKGITALLGMLNSCASNIAVVNIDNGFGAAYLASVICNKIYS